MDCLKEYKRIYENEIASKALPFETLRQRMLKKYKIFVVISYFLIFIIPFWLIIENWLPNPLLSQLVLELNLSFGLVFSLAFIIPAFGFCFLAYSDKYKKKYASIVKKNFLPILCPLFENLKYSKGQKIISDEEVIAAGFFNERYSVRVTDDEFIGEYRGIEFKISEDKFATGRKYPKLHYYLNINFRNICKIDSHVVVDSAIRKARVYIKKKNVTLLIVVSAVFILSLSQVFIDDKNFELMVLFIGLFISMFIILASFLVEYFLVAEFEKNKSDFRIGKSSIFNLKEFFASNEGVSINEKDLALLLSKINYGPLRLSYYDDNLMLNYKIAKNVNLFEFADINRPIGDVDFCKEFIKQISAIYKFIDYVKDGKENLES